jgi:ABC-type glycerol-3-phosphate transport system substrate-binding protein
MSKRLAPTFALLLILAGCAQATAGPGSPLETPTPSDPTPTRPGSAGDASSVGAVDLQLWLPFELSPDGETAQAAVLAQQLADFAAGYASLTVEVTEKAADGEGGLLEFLLAAQDAAPSVLPDLAILDSDDLAEAYEAGLLQPLGDLLAPARLTDQFGFAADLASVAGEQVGFVLGSEILHAAYRPALVATPPVSWTQVTSGRISFLFPGVGQNGLVNDSTLIQYLGAGGDLASAQGDLDGDALEDVLSFYRTAVFRGAIAPSTVLDIADADEAWDRFVGGEGALTVVRSTRYWLEADDTAAAVQLPTADGTPLTFGHGWVIVLITDSPARQSAALALIEALTAPEAHAAWTRAGGYLPATKSALRMWTDSSEDRSLLQALLESAQPRPQIPAGTAQAIQDALEAVLRGEATPAQAVAAVLEPQAP